MNFYGEEEKKEFESEFESKESEFEFDESEFESDDIDEFDEPVEFKLDLTDENSKWKRLLPLEIAKEIAEMSREVRVTVRCEFALDVIWEDLDDIRQNAESEVNYSDNVRYNSYEARLQNCIDVLESGIKSEYIVDVDDVNDYFDLACDYLSEMRRLIDDINHNFRVQQSYQAYLDNGGDPDDDSYIPEAPRLV